jgi:hypothetical protein
MDGFGRPCERTRHAPVTIGRDGRLRGWNPAFEAVLDGLPRSRRMEHLADIAAEPRVVEVYLGR